ncbi:MAG: sugar ABC transporter permease [Lachnospiraceae bacterium]|nr:sugar ABC transporter permease [Lachnospiraceae bacterium]
MKIGDVEVKNTKLKMEQPPKKTLGARMWKYRQLYLLLLPALIYVVIFSYGPMYGIQIAFKNYKGALGIWKSPWVGFKHFKDFFGGYYFWDLLKNTLLLSVYNLVANFPIPIVVALILNETGPKLKKTAQTILYAPHFISTVVLCGMIVTLFSKESGVVNTILEALGLERIYFMGEPGAFRHLYVWSGVWQQMGWNAIIYIAALSAVDPSLHEAAAIDGATRMQRIIHINLPTIMPTIIITLIMAVGNIASVAYEKAFLLQTNLNVDVSEIISTYVYKRGIVDASYSFSTAVGLFNNIINIIMLCIANTISRKVSETSLF